jgi:hypothetical protein
MDAVCASQRREWVDQAFRICGGEGPYESGSQSRTDYNWPVPLPRARTCVD